MKIAFSASYFNCPAVAAILAECHTVYTTNSYALAKMNHPNIILARGDEIREMLAETKAVNAPDVEIVDFHHLYMAFYRWILTATDAELLENWSVYFQSSDTRAIRSAAKGIVEAEQRTAQRVAQRKLQCSQS